METFVRCPSSELFNNPTKCAQLSVAEEVALEMGVSEAVVKMARAYCMQKHGTDFETAVQLYLLAEELMNNSQKQCEVVKMMHEAELEEDKKKHGLQDFHAKDMLKEKIVTYTFAEEAVKGDRTMVMGKTAVKDVTAEMHKSPVAEVQPKSTAQLMEKVEKLSRANHRLRQRKVCRKCKEVELASSGVTFLPCGHFITCEVCSEACDQCPACGKTIMGTVRTYLS